MKDVLGRRVSALVGALVLTGVLAVASDAGHQTSVASYTGCLNTSSGMLSKLAVGDSPSSACGQGQVVIHLSGGDMTSVDAGVGLSGTSAEGEANLDVDFADFGSCAEGSAIRVNGVTATCETDDDTTYSAGSGLTLTGTTFAADTSVVQARVSGACAVGAAIREINADGTVVCESTSAAASGGGELLLVQRHEFDANEVYFNLDTPGAPAIREWEVVESGSGQVILDPELEPAYPTTSALTLHTDAGDGTALVYGNRKASVSDGTLIFKAHVLDAYAEVAFVYGNRQPRGLAGGGDRESNAIEFVNTLGYNTGPYNTGVRCRTAAGGSVTETAVSLGQWTRRPAMYQIVATEDEARFYVNGVLKCTHTTDIPTVPLNIFLGTSNNGFGNIPLIVDWVSFEQRPA